MELDELKPWYAVAVPHEDIREGRLDETVFAANLWAVYEKRAPDVYNDPVAFFEKTYLTAGLTNVLKKAAAALSGDAEAGDRIVGLQTSFGGGKTHVLVALWHLAANSDKLRGTTAGKKLKAAGIELPRGVKGVAVFTNETCDPTQGHRTKQGVRTRTLWGELAVQLGGKELYAQVAANDESRSAPKGIYHAILSKAAPCLILLDEMADYCVAAAGIDVGRTTLADQTISFVQELTTAAQQVPGVAVIATLPASKVEVASSERGQEILEALERRFGRMGKDVRPVSDEEIYEVVRSRLFEKLGDPDIHKVVADTYLRLYQQHKNEVPTDAARATYRDRILASYPFHPALIDTLYLRWGSHGEFQRTRGVLRLLASVVGNLYKRRKTETMSQPLIQPCHIDWTIDALHAALTRLWGGGYESVVSADVVGGKSNAAFLDEERGGEYVTERIGQGLAAAILLGSFGATGERQGCTTKDLKLAVGRPGLNWSYTEGGILGLEERAHYLGEAPAGSLGKRYWFGTKPRLNKLVLQYKSQFAPQDFDEEIVALLRDEARKAKSGDATWRVMVDPETDLPEQKTLVLVLMPPGCEYAENGEPRLIASPATEKVLALSQRCGTRGRTYRNTLLFLLPSPRGLGRLRGAFRDRAALDAIKHDYGTQLDAEQRDDLSKRLTAAHKAVTELLSVAYTHIARVEGQGLVVVALSEAGANLDEHLRAAWRQVVEEEEWVLRKVGTVTLQKSGLVPKEGGTRVRDAIDAFLRLTDKPMIATRSAVVQGLLAACRDRVIGLGRGINPGNLTKKWCGDGVAVDLDEDGVWIIPPFEPAEQKGGEGGGGGTGGGGTGPNPQPPDVGPEPPVTGVRVRRIHVSGDVAVESWADLFRCFVNPLARMHPKKLTAGAEFDATFADGQGPAVDDTRIKALIEAANQLGLTVKVEK